MTPVCPTWCLVRVPAGVGRRPGRPDRAARAGRRASRRAAKLSAAAEPPAAGDDDEASVSSGRSPWPPRPGRHLGRPGAERTASTSTAPRRRRRGLLGGDGVGAQREDRGARRHLRPTRWSTRRRSDWVTTPPSVRSTTSERKPVPVFGRRAGRRSPCPRRWRRRAPRPDASSRRARPAPRPWARRGTRRSPRTRRRRSSARRSRAEFLRQAAADPGPPRTTAAGSPSRRAAVSSSDVTFFGVRRRRARRGPEPQPSGHSSQTIFSVGEELGELDAAVTLVVDDLPFCPRRARGEFDHLAGRRRRRRRAPGRARGRRRSASSAASSSPP